MGRMAAPPSRWSRRSPRDSRAVYTRSRPYPRGTATLGANAGAAPFDAVIIAIGGGGLCGGASAAIKLLKPDCLVLGVEPTGSDTMTRSFALGKPIDHAEVKTIADSLAPPFALPYSFGLCRANVDDIVLVDDDQIRAAMALLFRT